MHMWQTTVLAWKEFLSTIIIDQSSIITVGDDNFCYQSHTAASPISPSYFSIIYCRDQSLYRPTLCVISAEGKLCYDAL